MLFCTKNVIGFKMGIVIYMNTYSNIHRYITFVKHLYIFWSFGYIGLSLSQFENRVPLKPVLAGKWAVFPHYITAHGQTH